MARLVLAYLEPPETRADIRHRHPHTVRIPG